MIITHLMMALEKYNIKVIGASFDGDLSAVKFFCNDFAKTVIT